MDVHVKELFANVGEIANLLEILHTIDDIITGKIWLIVLLIIELLPLLPMPLT